MIMQKKLTITIDEGVYYKLRSVIGEGKISKFIEHLVKPYVINSELEFAYQEMVQDFAAEQEAFYWIEGMIEDDYETR
jgi:predicted CopG family antitoxin